MQTSNPELYKRARADAIADNAGNWPPETIPTIGAAFDAGYNHAHGIACHNVPKIGDSYWTESEGKILVDADNVQDVHATLCFEAESNARCYSPWEHIAHDLNSQEDEWLTETLWTVYDLGVAAAIEHDLKGYDYE